MVGGAFADDLDDVPEFDGVFASLLELVHDAGIALVELAADEGEIVVQRDLLAGRIEEAHREIDGGAEPLAANFKDQGLAGLGGDTVEVGLAVFGNAGDGGGGRDAVSTGVARRGIDEEFDGVGSATGGEEGEFDGTVRRIGGDSKADAGGVALHGEDGSLRPFEAGFAGETFAEESHFLVEAGRNDKGGDGIEMGGLADIEFVGEGRIEPDVGGLDDQDVFASFGW